MTSSNANWDLTPFKIVFFRILYIYYILGFFKSKFPQLYYN
jgi:hypothetical protein